MFYMQLGAGKRYNEIRRLWGGLSPYVSQLTLESSLQLPDVGAGNSVTHVREHARYCTPLYRVDMGVRDLQRMQEVGGGAHPQSPVG
jgi:hypothetical protein